jgi:hypothetical protein
MVPATSAPILQRKQLIQKILCLKQVLWEVSGLAVAAASQRFGKDLAEQHRS